MDENGGVKNLVQVDDRRKPVGREIAGVREHEQSPRDFLPQFYVVGIYLQGRGRDHVRELQNPGLVDFSRENRQNFRFFGLFFFSET